MKVFTHAEATALLPRINALLDEIIRLRDLLIAQGASLQSVLAHADGNGGNKHSSEYVVAMKQFNDCLNAFKDLGCELKDIDAGLVDFPAYRDGELVYLCWKRGETAIEFWHALDSGYAGRQPLD
ncbi:MAG: DUF2203 domain-containing protein [Chloroflexi bacterium]|nr:DUF2203 domain-containing protein [Chloroflexota bacterium]